MFIVCFTFTFLALCFAVHFTREKHWTWIVAPAVTLVLSAIMVKLKSVPLIIILSSVLGVLIVYLNIENLINKRK